MHLSWIIYHFLQLGDKCKSVGVRAAMVFTASLVETEMFSQLLIVVNSHGLAARSFYLVRRRLVPPLWMTGRLCIGWASGSAEMGGTLHSCLGGFTDIHCRSSGLGYWAGNEKSLAAACHGVFTAWYCRQVSHFTGRPTTDFGLFDINDGRGYLRAALLARYNGKFDIPVFN